MLGPISFIFAKQSPLSLSGRLGHLQEAALFLAKFLNEMVVYLRDAVEGTGIGHAVVEDELQTSVVLAV